MIAAKGNEVANPHPWVWGFITLIHTHISAPTYGLLEDSGQHTENDQGNEDVSHAQS